MFGKRILKSFCILFGVLLLLMASAFADGEVTEGLTLDREVVIVAKGRSLQLKVWLPLVPWEAQDSCIPSAMRPSPLSTVRAASRAWSWVSAS